MIFADKLIQLRKKCGWSQEELANQMDVTRQSVSKWEAAQATPDLEKMIRLARLFSVTTDYLLLDEMKEAEVSGLTEDIPEIRRVTMEEASDFMKVKAATAKFIATATFLCILAPSPLIILGAASEVSDYGISVSLVGGVGFSLLFILVAAAVAIYITSGNKTAQYAYLETEHFELEYGVSGMVKERREQYKRTYSRCNISGTCICIMAVIPITAIAVALGENAVVPVASMVILSMLIAGIGVIIFIRSGIVWESFQKLLQEGEYTKKKKENQMIRKGVTTAYWMTATALFLLYSFIGDNLENSWIIWAVAGVLFPAVIAIMNAIESKK